MYDKQSHIAGTEMRTGRQVDEYVFFSYSEEGL